MNNETVRQFSQKIAQFLPFVLFSCALYIVHTELRAHQLRDILSFLRTIPVPIICAAFLLTIVNYLVLVGYDWLALRFTGHKHIPLSKMIAASLLSYSISNNTGHAWASGGSIRYRFYSKWDVPGWDILKISLFQTVTYLLGALSLGLVGSLLLPHYLSKTVQEPPAIHWLSLICASFLLVYWIAVFLWRKPLVIKGLELYLPSPKMAFWQTLVASIDVILSSLVLWVLLLGKINIGFGAFAVIFVVAQVAGVVSQVPGGIGVFESAFLWLMSSIGTNHQQHLILIGALFLYRIIYYFLPLLLAGVGLLSYEIYSRRELLISSSRTIRRMLLTIVPQLYSILLILAGGILLFSGSIPIRHSLQDLFPLPVIELSHLTGSLAGVLLLFLARGIRLKIDVAWYGSIGLLCLGIATSLLKGFAWHEALVLSAILLLMIPTRSYFQRHSSLLHMTFSKSWLTTITMVLMASIWLGFFAYRDVEYSHDLWWQFSYNGNAPRFLRALLLVSIVMVVYGLSRLLSVSPAKTLHKPTEAELIEARHILVKGTDTTGFLAILGDKYLFWNTERTAFIMFAATSKFWIAMGDPVGERTSIDELLYQFIEQADFYGAKAVFYQVGTEWLPSYLNLGLLLFKLGEEAKVDLSTFSLQGKQRDSQRNARNKFLKMGYQFEILTGSAVDAVLPELKQISDNWLLHKNTREKRFSLGFFDESYLRNTDMAVIKDETGHIKAFANVWQTAGREELSVDLMRYHADSPKGIMDFLFTELMLWGKAEKYQWFSLGVAPLAGLNHRPLSPLWNKLGAAIFKLGDQFYNFEGLYEYKAKYSPHWQARYLAAPSGLSMPFILMRITRLISGGWQGVFGK